jgi:hypothetical protein
MISIQTCTLDMKIKMCIGLHTLDKFSNQKINELKSFIIYQKTYTGKKRRPYLVGTERVYLEVFFTSWYTEHKHEHKQDRKQRTT